MGKKAVATAASLNGVKELERAVVPIASLNAAKYNPRKIDTNAMAGLEKSIDEFGMVQEIVVNKNSMTIIGGHQRIKALKRKNEKTVAVVFVELDEIREKSLNVALNNSAITGSFTDALQGLLDEIERKRSDLFESLLLHTLRSDVKVPAGRSDPDDVPAVSTEPPKTKIGDIYLLGNHRLLCGDATKPECYHDLMGKETVHIAFTSPPYNASGSAITKSSRYISPDDKTSDEYYHLLDSSTRNMMKYSGCVVINIQALAGNKVCVMKFLYDFRNHIIDIAIWNKGNAAPAIQKNVMSSQFEFMIFLSPKEGATRIIPCADFQGTISNVYDAPPNETMNSLGFMRRRSRCISRRGLWRASRLTKHASSIRLAVPEQP
jgi:ParB-like nuclease domain/DNA methylase